jgi:mRNA interferase RelE/StbE
LAWTIEYDESAVKDLKKLDPQVQREILDFMEKRIGRAQDPRSFGKPGLCSAALQGGIFDSFRSLRPNAFRLSRYRLRDYRIICQLQQPKLIVLVVAIGHRSIIYDD